MATAFFPSLADAEVIEVEFVRPDDSTQAMRLLVDSGFTGSSSFVLLDSPLTSRSRTTSETNNRRTARRETAAEAEE